MLAHLHLESMPQRQLSDICLRSLPPLLFVSDLTDHTPRTRRRPRLSRARILQRARRSKSNPSTFRQQLYRRRPIHLTGERWHSRPPLAKQLLHTWFLQRRPVSNLRRLVKDLLRAPRRALPRQKGIIVIFHVPWVVLLFVVYRGLRDLVLPGGGPPQIIQLVLAPRLTLSGVATTGPPP